ncbi:DNA adenine methylase [Ancylobacter sp. G4_0304]|uniref:DNA adenine methylase n=1 Tax=Ancylobacter sp. G4_0304 TaxID=3114289 RepID=UPI0039C5F5F8
MQFNTPLRYPGGKARLAQYAVEILRLNDLVGGHYVEPYAGGAGIALTLLYLEYVQDIHINDLNRSVHAFWKAALDHNDDLCKLIRDRPVTLDERARQKLIQRDQDAGVLELGFSTFFLNRTNRSGIISGGAIGGNDQSGMWKIDARYKKDDLISRIEKIADYKSRIHLYNQDASYFITSTLKKIPKRSLIYLDPPYYTKGKKLYQNHYKESDHISIAKIVSNIRQKWIMSYDHVPAILELYDSYRKEQFALSWSARARYEGSEVMIFGPGVVSPPKLEVWRGIAA